MARMKSRENNGCRKSVQSFNIIKAAVQIQILMQDTTVIGERHKIDQKRIKLLLLLSNCALLRSFLALHNEE